MAETPPGPSGPPLLGNTLDIVRGQGEYIRRVAAEYGPVARISMLGVGDIVLVSDPELVETVLFDERYTKATVAQDALSDLLGEGLLLSTGEQWRRQRERVQPAFAETRLDTYATSMVDRTQSFVDSLTPGETIDVGECMRQLTFEILLDALFGTDVDYEQYDLRAAADALLAPGEPRNQPIAFAVPKWVPIPMWRRYNRAIERFEAVIETLVDRQRAGEGASENFLATLLGEGERSQSALRDQLMTMLFAGHETTATALTFTWQLLGTHPDVADRLHAELDTVLDGPTPAPADVPALTYTRRVLRESLRLYPPVPAIGREPTTNVELGGYHIPQGTTVAPCQWVVHHDPAHFEDPWTFRPSRWADTTDRHRFAYFPFGGGPRRCVGEQFALTEATLVVATVARQYRLVPTSDEPLDPSVSIVTQPGRPIEAVARPRES